MPIIGGPDLNKLRDELVEWYVGLRQRMIGVLEEPLPYGSRKLTPDEQLDRFLGMTDEDWEMVQARLQERFRGLPDADSRVARELRNFSSRMQQLMRRRQAKADQLVEWS